MKPNFDPNNRLSVKAKKSAKAKSEKKAKAEKAK